jgi:YceI-like domain
MHMLSRPVLLLCLGALLAGCPTTAVRPPPPAAPLPPVDLRGAALYHVSAQDSEVNIRVYRGGALSRLGHNHVVTSRNLSGRVWIHPSFERSGFELSFPVRELIVDDPDSRRAAGGDFPPDVSAADKDGTRKNMLGPEVLDAERYPTITMRSVKVAGTPEAPLITVRITIKDVSRDLEVPAQLRTEGRRLVASGKLEIRQTDFGIKPFSAALGAIEVQDLLPIDFRILAQQREAAGMPPPAGD